MLDDMLERLTIVLEDHNNFELSKPIWFQPDKIDMNRKGRCDSHLPLFLTSRYLFNFLKCKRLST